MLVAAAILAGCARVCRAPVLVGAQRLQAAPVDADTLLGALDPTGVIDRPASLVLIESDRGFRIVDGESDSDRVRTVRSAGSAALPWRRYTADNRIEHLGIGDDGSIVIGVIEDLNHNQTTYYDPPLPLLPAGLAAGGSVTSRADMIVRPRNNDTFITDRGTCTQTITLEGTQRVRVGDVDLEALRVTTSYEADLGLADVTQTSTDWYVTGFGLAAQQASERVSAFIFSSNTSRMMVAE